MTGGDDGRGATGGVRAWNAAGGATSLRGGDRPAAMFPRAAASYNGRPARRAPARTPPLFAVASLLVTLTIALAVTRVATVALMATGLSRESARFQARSAFTGAGFTTTESESVVNHPVRRRVVMVLMLLGNIGIAAVAATVMATIVARDEQEPWSTQIRDFTILAVGLGALIFLSNSEWVERKLNRLIGWALRRYTSLNVQDYVALLHLASGYGISELRVEPGDWLANKTLIDVALPHEGVLVLGVQRKNGTYIGAPQGKTEIHPYDTLLLYAALERIRELDTRRAGRQGDQVHAEAVREQERVEQREEAA